MKKLIYSMAALATMLFASCQQQELPEPVPQESTVTYTVELPGVQTKAIGDGFNVDQLVYEVWKTDEEEIRNLWNPETATRLYQKTVPMATIGGEQKTTITLNLVHDQNYTVLFWAQNSKAVKDDAGNDVPAYVTEDLRAVTYAKEVTDGSYLSNNENMAAFYNVAFLKSTEVENSGTRRVELKRPFAQLNIATKNTPDEYKVTVNKSKVQITKVPTVFDVAQNIAAKPADGIKASPAVDDNKSFLYGSDYVPGCSDTDNEPLTLTVNSNDYEYVAMNYIFASDNVKVEYWIDVTLTATDPLTGQNGTATTDDVVIYNEVSEVPLKENYRTNIIGNLLSSNTTYEVVVDASWDDVNDPELNGDGYEVEVWNGTELTEPKKNADGDYMIEYASDLGWLAAAVNGTLPAENTPSVKSASEKAPAETFEGATFILTEDIDLNNQLWTPIGATGKFLGTFDGNGKTISNLNVSTEGKASAGLFAAVRNVKNLTVKNATISGHYKTGVISGDGLCARIENCHVDGATVTSTPYNNDDANHVGGIVGYLSAESTAYVKNCSVRNATITGYRDVAGIAGTANTVSDKPEVSGNTVINVTIIADQTSDYKEVKAPNFGEIVGRIHANTILADNTIGENVVAYVLVDNATRLQNVLLDENVRTGETLIRFAADIAGNVTVDQKEGKNIVIDGDTNKYDGTITIDGNARNTGAETILIKNINFETESEGVYFVEMNSTDGALRYAHNVTIDNCTFKGTETTVGARFRQCYNIVFSNCEVVSGHSLAQLYGCTGVTVDNVNVKTTTGGISFGTSLNCLVENSTFDVTGPESAIRVDGSVSTTLTVRNTTAKAELPLMIRYVSGDYNVVLEDVKLEKDGLYHVVFTSDKVNCVIPTSNFSISGADNYAVFPINADGSYTDEEGNTVVQTDEGLKAALAAAENGDIIKVEAGEYAALKDVKAGVTIDATGAVFTGVSSAPGDGAKIVGATFKNEFASGKYCFTGSMTNTVFENCKFESYESARWCYANGEIVFNNCTFGTESSWRGIHFDSGEGNVTFNDCDLYGFQAFGSSLGKVTFNDCDFFKGCSTNVVNMYGKFEYNSCEFVADYYCDCATNGVEAAFNNCSYTDGTDIVNIVRFDYDPTTCTITFDDKKYVANGLLEDANGNYVAYSAAGLTAALANKEVKNIVLMPGTYEGTFQINNGTIESEDATNKAVIKGRVECINPNVTFKNVKFDYNDASKQEFSSAVVGNPKGHPAIVGVYGGAQHSATFESCDFAFKSGYNSEKAPGAVSHYGAVNLVMNECVLDGEGNPIYAKTNIEMTGCTVKMYGGNAVLSLNYSNEGRKVIFKNNIIENKSTNGAKTYGMQMLSTNGKAYKDMYFDVQGNTVDVMFAIGSGYTFEGVSYATGSEQIN